MKCAYQLVNHQTNTLLSKSCRVGVFPCSYFGDNSRDLQMYLSGVPAAAT